MSLNRSLAMLLTIMFDDNHKSDDNNKSAKSGIKMLTDSLQDSLLV